MDTKPHHSAATGHDPVTPAALEPVVMGKRDLPSDPLFKQYQTLPKDQKSSIDYMVGYDSLTEDLRAAAVDEPIIPIQASDYNFNAASKKLSPEITVPVIDLHIEGKKVSVPFLAHANFPEKPDAIKTPFNIEFSKDTTDYGEGMGKNVEVSLRALQDKNGLHFQPNGNPGNVSFYPATNPNLVVMTNLATQSKGNSATYFVVAVDLKKSEISLITGGYSDSTHASDKYKTKVQTAKMTAKELVEVNSFVRDSLTELKKEGFTLKDVKTDFTQSNGQGLNKTLQFQQKLG